MFGSLLSTYFWFPAKFDRHFDSGDNVCLAPYCCRVDAIQSIQFTVENINSNTEKMYPPRPRSSVRIQFKFSHFLLASSDHTILLFFGLHVNWQSFVSRIPAASSSFHSLLISLQLNSTYLCGSAFQWCFGVVLCSLFHLYCFHQHQQLKCMEKRRVVLLAGSGCVWGCCIFDLYTNLAGRINQFWNPWNYRHRSNFVSLQ